MDPIQGQIKESGYFWICQLPGRFCQTTQLMKTSNSPDSTAPRNRRQEWVQRAAQHPSSGKSPGIWHIEVGKCSANRLTPREKPSQLICQDSPSGEEDQRKWAMRRIKAVPNL